MKCTTVQILGTGISQLEGNRAVVTVPREEMRGVALSHETKSRRPFLRFLSGFVMVLTGLVLLIGAFLLAEGGVYHLQVQSLTFGVPLLPLGLWLMVAVGLWLVMGLFRGNYFISIQTEQGTRKVFFEEKTDIRDIRSFIQRANREMGYDIDLSIMQTMHIKG